jgi:hypothetical protein
MRRVLLRIAELCAWTGGAFAVFLGFRIFLIFLSVVNPAFCDISCDLGKYAVPVSLAVFVVGWSPLFVIAAIRHARRSLSLWWTPHIAVITTTFAVAMGYVAGVSLSFIEVDSRNVVLAGAAAVFVVAATVALFAAVLLDRTLPQAEQEIHFFQEDLGE